ncbi:TPM domain-containing protein [Pedobacter sp. SYP-B3415]|uniref:TPM domain-containing protein n=1 Tax=Pedobacter sp. SYP-B3415 TaxID=2496641 RepID=UPI00101DF89A|nr:TPM domain-containing protein [Pedobacter sp. SYP-B3415]
MAIFSEEEQDAIAQAIEQAEKHTSGEIRIAIDSHCPGDAYETATRHFEELNMHRTVQRNGVLIYLAFDDHKFAIIGDRGIDQRVPADFWVSTKNLMQEYFVKGEFTTGIVAGIRLAGEKLSAFFPSKNDYTNELPNEVVFLNSKTSE